MFLSINWYISVKKQVEVKDFKERKEALNRELAQFTSILDELLPRYTLLLEKKNISKDELSELGEIEHYLIQVNAQITALKEMLEEDLYGHSLDVYYKLKSKALAGDEIAKAKLVHMRAAFQDALKGDAIFNWN